MLASCLHGMEVTLLNDLSCKNNGSDLVCGRHGAVIDPPLEPGLGDVVEADDGNEGYGQQCAHFTLREYVSEIRKKDAKNCCPFTILHDHKCGEDDHACSLPPLLVTRFRLWNCPNCSHKEADPMSPKPHGGLFMRVHRRKEAERNEGSDAFLKIGRDATCLSSVQEPSQEKSTGTSVGKLLSTKKENGSVLRNLSKVGFEGYDNIHYAGTSLTGFPYGCNGARMSEDVPESPNCTRIASGGFDEKGSSSLAVGITRSTNHASVNGSDENLKAKKTQKVRSLSDILDSVDCLPKKALETKYCKTSKYEDSKKGRTENLRKQWIHVSRTKRLKPSMDESGEESLQDEHEGGVPLKQWLKGLSHKSSGHQTCAKIEHVKCAIRLPGSDPSSDNNGCISKDTKRETQLHCELNQISRNEKLPKKAHKAHCEQTCGNHIRNHDLRPPSEVLDLNNERTKLGDKNSMDQGEFDQEADFSDFPMEIIELLARIRLEKRTKDSEDAAAGLRNLSEVAEIVKDGSFLDGFKDHPKHNAPCSNPQQKIAKTSHEEGCAWPAARKARDADRDRRKYRYISREAEHIRHKNQDQTKPFLGHVNKIHHPANGLRANRPKENFILDATEKKKKRLQACQPDNVRDSFGHPLPEKLSRMAACEIGTLRRKRKLDSTVHQEMNSLGGGGGNSSPYVTGRNGCMHETTSLSNTYNSDAVSALHLLSLMDPGTASGECFTSPMKTNNGGNWKLHRSSPIDEPTGPEDGEGTSNKTREDMHQWNAHKPLRPLPRLGELSSRLRDELTSRSPRRGVPSGFTLELPNKMPSFKVYQQGKDEGAGYSHHLTAQTCCVSPRHHPEKHPLSPERNGECGDGRIKPKDGAVRSLESSCVESCVVNRNPADFSTADEDGEYMISYNQPRMRRVPKTESPQSKAHLVRPKRRKKMKLSSLEGLMRS